VVSSTGSDSGDTTAELLSQAAHEASRKTNTIFFIFAKGN